LQLLKPDFCGGVLVVRARQLSNGSACCRGVFQANSVDEKVNNDIE
jgi:hypothetical protein